VVCGLIDTDAGAVLKVLRGALGMTTPVVGCDGLLPASLLFDGAGAAARGVQVALPVVGLERLPSAGRALVRRFGIAQAGGRVDPAAVLAAQAAEVLVSAVARSDGTRESIRRELLRTHIPGGLLGTVRLDAQGDPVPARVTIYRLARPATGDEIASTGGAVATTVLEPPVRLWKP
jgi:ABC-type branched-subunit amino acid transport system substrate-binding protein